MLKNISCHEVSRLLTVVIKTTHKISLVLKVITIPLLFLKSHKNSKVVYEFIINTNQNFVSKNRSI